MKGNTVRGDSCTGPTWTACGLLYYQAAGVKASNNVLFGNQLDICNAARGGGNINP